MKMVIYMEHSLRAFGRQVLPLVHYHLSLAFYVRDLSELHRVSELIRRLKLLFLHIPSGWLKI
jgi:hypothetical protein